MAAPGRLRSPSLAARSSPGKARTSSGPIQQRLQRAGRRRPSKFCQLEKQRFGISQLRALPRFKPRHDHGTAGTGTHGSSRDLRHTPVSRGPTCPRCSRQRWDASSGVCFAMRFELAAPSAMAKAAVAREALGPGDRGLLPRSRSRHQTQVCTVGNGVFLRRRAEPLADLCPQ